MQKINISWYGHYGNTSYRTDVMEMVRRYINGEKIFVEFDGSSDSRRTGSIGQFHISDDCLQDLMYGAQKPYFSPWGQKPPARPHVKPDASLLKVSTFDKVPISGHVTWDKRKNKVDAGNCYSLMWLKDYDETLGTKWVWAKPDDDPAVTPQDKLGRDIKKGDFISYVLYHFDNGYNGAGIYYGKVTKIENDGTVHAKNIKLKDDDRVAEKRIKDNSLIVIMSKDLMDKLMIARLSTI